MLAGSLILGLIIGLGFVLLFKGGPHYVYLSRVWPPVFALPAGGLFWAFFEIYKGKADKKYQGGFFLCCVVLCLSFVSFRIENDYRYYKYKKTFSEVLNKCNGIVHKTNPQNVRYYYYYKNYDANWKSFDDSILFYKSKNIKTALKKGC